MRNDEYKAAVPDSLQALRLASADAHDLGGVRASDDAVSSLSNKVALQHVSSRLESGTLMAHFIRSVWRDSETKRDEHGPWRVCETCSPPGEEDDTGETAALQNVLDLVPGETLLGELPQVWEAFVQEKLAEALNPSGETGPRN
jgi:hypothetical protein